MLQQVLIYGAGSGAENALNFIKLAYPNIKVVGVIDGDNKKHGKIFNEFTIKSPLNVNDIQFDYIFIASQFYYEIYNSLIDLAIPEDTIKIFSKDVLQGTYRNDGQHSFAGGDGFIGRELERSGRGFFIVSLPKSGTTFTRHNAIKISNKAFPKAVYHPEHKQLKHNGLMNKVDGICTIGAFSSETIVDIDALRADMDDSAIVATHMPANVHNLRALKESGIDKVTVLIRDPKDALVSWYHHLEKDIEFWRHDIQKFYYLPEEYLSWTSEKKLAFQVKTYFPICVNWIESWLYEAGRQNEVEIRIVFFEQLKQDPQGYFKELFEFHDVEDYSLDLLQETKKGKMHYRRGISGSWKDEIPSYLHNTLLDIESERIENAISAYFRKSGLLQQLECKGKTAQDKTAIVAQLIRKYTLSNDMKKILLAVSEELLDKISHQELVEAIEGKDCFDWMPTLAEKFV